MLAEFHIHSCCRVDRLEQRGDDGARWTELRFYASRYDGREEQAAQIVVFHKGHDSIPFVDVDADGKPVAPPDPAVSQASYAEFEDSIRGQA